MAPQPPVSPPPARSQRGPLGVLARGWGWRHAGRRDWAVSELDLAIEPGERVLLRGASGSGKSTLLAALAGVLGGADEGESTGTLLVDGQEAALRRHLVGLVLQDPESQTILHRVGDDVAFGLENLNVAPSQMWPRVREALNAVGLTLPLDHPTNALSGGQAQRLALAGALTMKPGLLLLDEPTANLDPLGVHQVREAVERTTADRSQTLIIVEHRVQLWRDLVDREIILGELPRARPLPPLVVTVPHSVTVSSASSMGVVHAMVGATPHSETVLSTHKLAVARPGTKPAARGIELSLGTAPTVITGPNGSGKTTTLLTLGGLIPPAAGHVRVEATLAGALPPTPCLWPSRALLSRIGTVFQNPEHQFLSPTVRAELAVGPRALHVPGSEIDSRVDELLERLDLTRLAEANPYTLSGGQKRRLSVGAMIATRPRVVLLDEPTYGQDPRSWTELVLLLRELVAAGHTVAAVSHDEHLAAALGAREWAMPRIPEQAR